MWFDKCRKRTDPQRDWARHGLIILVINLAQFGRTVCAFYTAQQLAKECIHFKFENEKRTPRLDSRHKTWFAAAEHLHGCLILLYIKRYCVQYAEIRVSELETKWNTAQLFALRTNFRLHERSPLALISILTFPWSDYFMTTNLATTKIQVCGYMASNFIFYNCQVINLLDKTSSEKRLARDFTRFKLPNSPSLRNWHSNRDRTEFDNLFTIGDVFKDSN